jgi:hypothetical protein
MQSSSQVPIQFLHTDGNDDYGSISRRSPPCISTKSLPLDESGYPSDGSTPCSTDSPHTSSHAPSNQNTPNDPALRVLKQRSPRHEPDLDVAGPTVWYDLDHSAVPSQGYIGDKEIRDHEVFYSIHPLADYLNYRQTTQPLTQDHQDLPAKISHLDQH